MLWCQTLKIVGILLRQVLKYYFLERLYCQPIVRRPFPCSMQIREKRCLLQTSLSYNISKPTNSMKVKLTRGLP